jgi:hypothetical protein
VAPAGPPEVSGYEVGEEGRPDRWGRAFAAVRKKDGKAVEVHVIAPGLLPSAAHVSEFAVKTRELIKLKDSRLVPLLAAGRVGESVYYVLEATEGENLARWIERTPRVPAAACAKIGAELSRALAAIEAFGTRHGRLRLEEVWIGSDGTVRLRHAGLTEFFRVRAPALFDRLPDLAFSSPEEISGESAGIASDAYGLGVLLHLCLSGALPFEEVSLEKLRARIASDPPPLLTDVPEGLAAIVHKLLSKAPGDRGLPFDDLERALQACGPKAEDAPTASVAAPRRLRSAPAGSPTKRLAAAKKPPLPLVAGAVGGVVLLLIAIISVMSGPGQTQRPKPRTGALIEEERRRAEAEREGTPAAPTGAGAKPASREQALQALPLFREHRLLPHLLSKNYATANSTIDMFERTWPEIPEEIAKLRAEVVDAAARDFEKIRKEALSQKARREGLQAATHVLAQKPRFVGVGDLSSRLDGLAMGLTAAGAAGGEQGLLARAESQLGEAKDLFARGHEAGSRAILEEAGFKAEEARIKFQALQDVLGPEEAKRVEALLKQTLQLTKLINDRKKSLAGARPVEPAPGERPGGDPTARPDPFESDPSIGRPESVARSRDAALVKEFGAYLAGAAANPDSAAPPAGLLDRLSASTDDGPLAAAYAAAKMLSTGEWKPGAEEADLLKTYADKILADPEKATNVAAFELLARSIEALKGRAAGADVSTSRVLALGHLSRIHPIPPELQRTLPAFSKALGIEHSANGWGCPEGQVIFRTQPASKTAGGLQAAFEESKSVRHPIWGVYRMIASSALCAQAAGEEAKDALELALEELKSINYPASEIKQDLTALKNIFTKLRPCKWCRGTHAIKCDYGCNDMGQVVKKCAVCNGTGRMPHVSQEIPCEATVPAGSHTWSESCTKCKGTRSMPCRSCKDPWTAPSQVTNPILKTAPCRPCGGRGLLFGTLRHPCVECYGYGSRIVVDRKR